MAFLSEARTAPGDAGTASLLVRTGEVLAFVGMLAPLILIGIAKFTAPEIEGLRR